MQQTFLASALALALAATIPSASATNAPSDHGSIALEGLEYLLGGDPPPAATARTRPAGDDSDLLWFTDQALAGQQNYAAAVAAYRSGKPVAVLRGPVSEDMDRILQGVFGVASAAALAIYVRNPDGTPHIHAVEELPQAVAARRNVATQMQEGIGTTVRSARVQKAALAESTDGAELIAQPRLAYTDSQYASSGNGAFVTLRGEFVRDTGRAYDIFSVSAKAEYVLKPNEVIVHRIGLIIPEYYGYELTLSAPGTTRPKLTAFAPTSSPTTDLNISESKTTSRSFGFSFGTDVSAGLADKVPSYGAKAPLGFDFSRSTSTTNTVAFSVKDYAIAASGLTGDGNTSRARWTMPLASLIRNNATYFGCGRCYQDTSKVTPAMRQVSTEGTATWTLPGNYTGKMTLGTDSVISMWAWPGGSKNKYDSPKGPRASVTVPADSVYLTRDVTVFIQSKAGKGECLQAVLDNVYLGPCPDVSNPRWQERLNAQWQLDSLGRYYNRGTKKCMQIRPASHRSDADPHRSPLIPGEIITAPCTTSRDQRWEWQADRIHSLLGGGYPDWRLFVEGGPGVFARTTGKPAHQSIPANPFHPLLNPWSSYPRAPTSSDFYPKLENIGINPPVSDEVKRLKASPPEERWEVIVLRQGLHR